jgi:hypothetical protein
LVKRILAASYCSSGAAAAAGDYDEKAVRAKIEGMIKDNKVPEGLGAA